MSGHDRVKRQLSVSSDSKLLDEDIREETRVILRPKKPPRPKSEVLLNQGSDHRRMKRFSAFGVNIILNLYRAIYFHIYLKHSAWRVRHPLKKGSETHYPVRSRRFIIRFKIMPGKLWRKEIMIITFSNFKLTNFILNCFKVLQNNRSYP